MKGGKKLNLINLKGLRTHKRTNAVSTRLAVVLPLQNGVRETKILPFEEDLHLEALLIGSQKRGGEV